MLKRYAAFQKCASCLRSNNFLIEIQKEGEQYFYIEKCPKCPHVEEVKKITTKEAKSYQTSSEE
jgi:phage FluMu protein Com